MNPRENFYLYTAIAILMLTAVFTFLILGGCASTSLVSRKKQLQQEHPNCFVEIIDDDLELICPDPFQTVQGTINYFEEKQK